MAISEKDIIYYPAKSNGVSPPRQRSMVQQVADALAQRIEGGEFSAGDRLPTTKELSEEHDVSIVTMSRSIKRLKERGLVTARARAGIFVAEARHRVQTATMNVVTFMVHRPLDFVSSGSLAELYLSQLNDEVVVGVQEQAPLSRLQVTAVPLAAQLWENPEAVVNFVRTHAMHADGVIFAGDVYYNPELLHSAIDLPTLFVSDHCYTSGINKLTCDTYEPARLVMKHLVERGYRRIAALGGADRVSYVRREDAWREVCTEHGLDCSDDLFIESTEEIDSIEQAVKAIIAMPEGQRPDAVFCFNDLRALVMLRLMREAGLEPGTDIAIAGFDGSPNALRQGITTAVIPFKQLGVQAASMMRSIIDGSAAQPMVGLLSGGLSVGKTT